MPAFSLHLFPLQTTLFFQPQNSSFITDFQNRKAVLLKSSSSHSSFLAYLYNLFSERLQMKVGDTVAHYKIMNTSVVAAWVWCIVLLTPNSNEK
jgi:hypothetical protein